MVREDKWSGATLRMFHARSIYRHLFLDEISATPTSIRRVRCRCDRNKIGASVALEINTSRRPTFTWPSLTGLTFRGTLFKNDVPAVVSGEPRLIDSFPSMFHLFEEYAFRYVYRENLGEDNLID